MVEDKESYMSKTHDQIHEGNYVLTNINRSEKAILRKLHRKLMSQLVDMGIKDFKEQRRFAVTGPVMASMALLVKVHKKNFQAEHMFLRLMTHRTKSAKSSLIF